MKKGNNAVICPPCGENVAVATKRGANKVGPILPLLPRLTAVLPPQGREMSQAFTLIELLVVVLIIGILAAVAVPQYQKAVYKSRAVEAMNMLRAIHEAQEVYYLANNEYADDITKLDVEVPTDSITTPEEEGNEEKPNKYYYVCRNGRQATCSAYVSNPNMPNFEYSASVRPAGLPNCFWCHIGTGDKNDNAKAICQTYGEVSTLVEHDWFKGKYWLLNSQCRVRN